MSQRDRYSGSRPNPVKKGAYSTKWGFQKETHPGEKCNYCRSVGHIIRTCVKKQAKSQEETKGSSKPRKLSVRDLPTLSNPFEEREIPSRDPAIKRRKCML